MRAINLYTISRKIHRELRPLYEKALSGRDKETKVREEEIGLLVAFLNANGGQIIIGVDDNGNVIGRN